MLWVLCGERQASVALSLFTVTGLAAGKCHLMPDSRYSFIFTSCPSLSWRRRERLGAAWTWQEKLQYMNHLLSSPFFKNIHFPGALGSLNRLDAMTHLSGCHRICQKSSCNGAPLFMDRVTAQGLFFVPKVARSPMYLLMAA